MWCTFCVSKLLGLILPPQCYYVIYLKKAVVHLFLFVFNFLYKFIYLFNLFLAALGLRCCVLAFSSCSEPELLFVAVRGLLIAVASLVAEHGL